MDDSNIDLTEVALLLWGKFSNTAPKKINKLPRGYKNRSFVIKTNNNERFVLKIYAQNFLSQEKIEARARIVKSLEEKGLPVLEMLQGENREYCQKVLISKDIYLGTISRFVEIPFSEMDVNEDIVRSTAQELQLLHKGMSQIKDTNTIKELDINKTIDDLLSESSLSKIDDYFQKDNKRIYRKNNIYKFYREKGEDIKNYFDKRKELLSKKTLNHGDFNLNNFLVINQKIEKVFDFDEMILAPLEYEIAIAIYYLDYPQEFYLDQLIEIFIRSYYSKIEDINVERVEDIIMFMKYRAFYRFARYFDYYQFTQNPGGHFSKFQDIFNRLDKLDSEQIFNFIVSK